jgi:hypothetical protein
MVNYLKPKNEKIKKRKIFAFDIETYSDKNKFVCGSIYGEKLKRTFRDKETMQKFLFTKKFDGALIFATNLGFDFFALFDEYKDYSKFQLCMRNDRFIFIKANHRYNIKFLDTLNFMKISVEQMGKILGIPKLKKPDCLGKQPSNLYEALKLEEYNMRDSEITFKFATFLQNSFISIGCNMKHTLASTAMNLFRTKYLKKWVEQPSKEQIKEMFNAYYGGRCESFVRGKVENLFYYDVNSMYPYVMKKYPYPLSNSLVVLKNFKNAFKYEGISYCSINAPYMKYPVLPFRIDNKLCFPYGKFKGWYCHNEIRLAIEHGYKILPIKSYICENTFYPFIEYVDDLYNKRLEHKKLNSPMEYIFKTLLNSLYGKFSQKLDHGEILFLENEKDNNKFNSYCDYNRQREKENREPRYKITCPLPKYKKISEGVSEDISSIYYVTDTDTTEYASFINPMISAYITAYSRIELYKLMTKAKDVYYVDTDSVMTPTQLNESNVLGGFKKEMFAEKGIIVKPKFYYLEGGEQLFIKTKGLSNLKTLMEFNNVIESKHFKYKKFTKFKESIRRGLSFNQIIEVEKILDMEDNKRKWKGEFSPSVKEESEPLFLAP